MKKLWNQLNDQYNNLISLGLYISWDSFLNEAYYKAINKGNYGRATMIDQLIKEEF